MAKPLNERLTTALSNPRVRSADLESLIAEVTLERDNRTGALAQATEDSVNFGLSDDDRDAAAQRSERARREVLALGSVLEKLEDKLTSRIATEQRQASEERHTELLAERDRIAGAKASAVIYSLMLTCRACGIDPHAWLAHVLTELPQRGPEADIEDLFPFNFADQNAEPAETAA